MNKRIEIVYMYVCSELLNYHLSTSRIVSAVLTLEWKFNPIYACDGLNVSPHYHSVEIVATGQFHFALHVHSNCGALVILLIGK